MDVSNIRNFKEFLLLYNQISETCFKRCINPFVSRDVLTDEENCLQKCIEKHVHANHKMMQIFMEVQPVLMQKRQDEALSIQASIEAQSQAEESVAAAETSTESVAAAQTSA